MTFSIFSICWAHQSKRSRRWICVSILMGMIWLKAKICEFYKNAKICEFYSKGTLIENVIIVPLYFKTIIKLSNEMENMEVIVIKVFFCSMKSICEICNEVKNMQWSYPFSLYVLLDVVLDFCLPSMNLMGQTKLLQSFILFYPFWEHWTRIICLTFSLFHQEPW